MAAATGGFLTIVSGLPRSGTSMMMRMLEMGGMPVLVDHIRAPDDDNPKGYYEFEPVKLTKEDPSWLEGSEGSAVKMVYRLLYDLPCDRRFRVLFMRRSMKEVLASQRVMLRRDGSDDGGITDAELEKLFLSEIESFYGWIATQSHFQLIDVDYNRVLQHPRTELQAVNRFLGDTLDLEAMIAVADRNLYRNRETRPSRDTQGSLAHHAQAPAH